MMKVPNKIVFVTECSPLSSVGGGSLRDRVILKMLARIAPVVPLWHEGDGARIPRTEKALWRRALSPFRPYVANLHDPAMEAAVREHAAPGAVLWLSRLAMGGYAKAGKALGYRVVLDEHNVEHELFLGGFYSRFLKTGCRKIEKDWCQAADRVTCVSEGDLRKLQSLAPHARLSLLPNLVDPGEYSVDRETLGDEILFPGSFGYEPNAEALEWFFAEVWPIVRKNSGSVPHLRVAGSGIAPQWETRIREQGGEVTLYPESMLPWFQRARAVVVPLKTGSGSRLKILEALACGRPVVSTCKGTEGLERLQGKGIILGDTAADFARAMQTCMDDPARAKTTGREGFCALRDSYTPEVWQPVLEALLREMVS